MVSQHSVAEFREKRAEMEAELTTLRQQLKDQAAQHAKDVSAFDRKKAAFLLKCSAVGGLGSKTQC